jgi:hypothetical protein
MFSVLKKKEAPDFDLDALVAPRSVVLLSARCCHPGAGPIDEALLDNTRAALAMHKVEIEPRVLTVTELQSRYLPRMSQLSPEHQAIAQLILRMFTEKSLSAFPMLFISGQLIVWGGAAPLSTIARRVSETDALTQS